MKAYGLPVPLSNGLAESLLSIAHSNVTWEVTFAHDREDRRFIRFGYRRYRGTYPKILQDYAENNP